MSRKRVAVLISGRGSNMGSLIRAASDSDFPAQIVGVISDRADAAGLETAERLGIETRVITRQDHPDKASQDAALDAALGEMQVDLVCLAGYMRLLTADFVGKWQGKMINIHPSLLPLFKGLDTHQRALDAGLRIHGCTVHFVTPKMDDGPIIAQVAVPVLPGDDADALSARVLKAEHQLYPLALRLVAQGKARMEGGRTVLSGVAADGSLFSPSASGEEVDIESLARMTP